MQVRICHDHQIASVYRGTPAVIRFVSRRTRWAPCAILGWETVGPVLTLRPGWVLQAVPSGLLY